MVEGGQKSPKIHPHGLWMFPYYVLFSYSHKCSTLVSIRSKQKYGLNKKEWICKFTTSTPFPLQDCTDIARKDFEDPLKRLFKIATFREGDDQNAKDAGSSLNHVLSYYDIRQFVCEKLNEYYQGLQPNQPNTGWL